MVYDFSINAELITVGLLYIILTYFCYIIIIYDKLECRHDFLRQRWLLYILVFQYTSLIQFILRSEYWMMYNTNMCTYRDKVYTVYTAHVKLYYLR